MNYAFPLKSEGCEKGFKDEKSRDKKMSLIFRKLWLSKQIRIAGSLPSGGRPEYVYSQHNIPDHLLQHEADFTAWFAATDWQRCRRFLDVDPQFRLDAEVWFGPNQYGVEWDSGSLRKHQVKKRWAKLKGLSCPLLVITRDQNRLDDLLEWSTMLGDIAHFTTKQDAIETPWDDIWIDLNGDYFAIEKPST